jgi:putative endonuclease
MFVVYVLKDNKGSLYKGVTNNIKRRLREHRSGKTRATAHMSELELIYSEEFDNFEAARQREVYFKTAAERRFLKTKMGL